MGGYESIDKGLIHSREALSGFVVVSLTVVAAGNLLLHSILFLHHVQLQTL